MRHDWEFLTGPSHVSGDAVLTVVAVCRVCGLIRSAEKLRGEEGAIDVTGECENPVRARYEQQ
jgi:hypothetical protein